MHSQYQNGNPNNNVGQDGRIDLNNYAPDPSKKNDLKRRLYDSGISNIPMPSVDREIEKNISGKPYSAKMNPNKIQALSPLKKKIDGITKNIYSNLQESYKEAAAQESKYKGEGTAEYYKSQHIMVPPPQILGPPLKSKGGKTLVPKFQNTNQGPMLEGMSSTNRILLNKGQKHGKLPSLGKTSVIGNMHTSNLDPNMRLLQGPPAMVMAGFEGGYSMNQKNLELARSKFLLDKLTGKLPPELRNSAKAKLEPLYDQDELRSKLSQQDEAMAKSPIDDEEEEEEKKDTTQQKWSDLDKYIELLLDSKSEEETVFVYLNTNPNNDPYDLLVCSYQERHAQKYYTLSGKGLTLYENDTPIEFLSLGQWLIERDSYNHIKELNFFKKFKKWKFMRMWKKTIKHQNRMKAQNSLEEKLFVLQDHFSVHLQKHRLYMIEMEKQRFIDTCPSGNVVTIEEFADLQVNRTKAISDEIQKFSDRCRENIRECISKVLSELRTRIVSEIALDEERKKNNPIQSNNTITMKRKTSTNVFEKLGFPPGMTYGHRSSLRKECSRFLRFAFLVDFLSYEALANIYLGSVRDMINRLQELDEGCNMKEVMEADYSDQNQTTGPARGMEPLFYVVSKLNDEEEIPASEIHSVQINEFVEPPKGESVIEDFDLLAHLRLEEAKEEGDSDEAAGEEEEAEVADPIFRKVVPNIEKFWIKMEPDEHDYIEVIMRTFGQGLEQIKSFERWSKHNDLTPYADALEEWDEKVGDNWDEPDSLKLDPKTWIQEDPLYTNQKEMVTDILKSAFEKMRLFMTRFAPLLEIYWRNKQADLKILVNEELQNPIDSLQNTIRLFNHYHEVFNTKLPRTADIGLIQLDSKSSRQKIQPTPKKYIAEIEQYIPMIIKERNDISKKWLEDQVRNLSKPDTGVEEFVEQNAFYNYANENFQNIRDNVDMYGQIYNVLKEFQLKVKKEDTDSFNESLTTISKLQGIMQEIESKVEEKKERYKKTVAQLVPKLDNEINEHYDRAQDPKYLDGNNIEKMFDIIQELNDIESQFKELEERKDTYNKYQEVLETQQTVFENLEDCREQITLRCLMWNSLDEWTQNTEKWKKTQFSLVDAEQIEKQGNIYSKHCMRLEKNLDPNPIQEKLKTAVMTFKDAMPIVKALRNEYLQEQHWAQIKGLIKKDFDINQPDFTLDSLIALDVNQFQEEITSISTSASQEYRLRQQLQEIDDIYKKTNFEIVFNDKVECNILGSPEELFTILDETLANINMILGSRFVKPLRKEAEEWKKNIMTLSDMVDVWYAVQRSWMYLENIFKAQDIKKAMPVETKNFDTVDKNFKILMQRTSKDPKCINIVRKAGKTLEDLNHFNDVLDDVQKKLEDYMEMKRRAFPRFYFLSNDELIDILANSQNLDVVQQHLKTCFDNVVKIQIKDEELVEGMYSNEKEYVPFRANVKARGMIEQWLMQLQDAMKSNLHRLLKAAIQVDYLNQERCAFTMSHFGQIVATTAQVFWCQNTELAISEQQSDPFALQEEFVKNVVMIADLTKLVCGELTELQRKVIISLVTTDVHARDIVEECKQMNVNQTHDFKWQQQLRYYWDEEIDNCVIKQVSATMNYGYEYMGAASRLVITPLTDRCWITISNALHIKLGANPSGPAGTGKTESTKDLAKAIACQCIVFNCSDQVDYIMMGRLFSGLCQQGCWTCLDEFNRIDIEVLSVIAQQLLQIRTALLDEKTSFNFEDVEIDLKPEFGCHVTMNPGYAGRTELPDNLKVMFRPVAMMIPNYGLIAEIMLGAEGFVNAKELSTKMVQLYKLSSEQLSQQDHYDFGLRAVKSVLVMAGSLKRANPQLNEDNVLIRAMRDANVPKFLKDDLPLFSAIISDLFPEALIAENEYGNFQTVIEQIIEDSSLQKKKEFIIKVIQLFETFCVRFGVMLVGPTGSGKTTCYQVLQDTMNHLRENGDEKTDDRFQMVKKIVLNPKSISMGEMYGEVNQLSQEWTDGLASKVMRNAAQEVEEEKTWVVFDGPVDAIWIENMNTVLDDNMTLCLANGQRIKLRSQMRMLFEVQDLAVASPATVSRCGMVYLTIEELGWRPFVKTWIYTFFKGYELMPDACKEHLWMLFEYTVDVALEFIRANCKEAVVTTDLQQVTSICNFLEYFIDESKGFKGQDDDKKKLLDCVFAWSYAWGIGGSLDQKGKEKFDTVVRDQFKSAQIPPSFTVFDYWFDLKKEKVFKSWTLKVASFVYDKDASFFDLMVPTTDTTKYAFCLESLLSIEKPLFFTGASGIGKSVVIQNQLQQIKEKGALIIININMSAQTTSAKTQLSIQEKLEKKNRKTLGAIGKKIAVFVDDINMPSVEEYGAQPPIELVRLFLDRKGLYERGTWDWKDVEDCTVIACAAPPSGGRAVITPRLSRRFNMFCLPEASQGTLSTIFSSIMKGFLGTGFSDKVKNLEEAAITSTIDIYIKIQEELRPTPSKFHYLFNLRDVSKVIQGILMTKAVSIQNDELFMKLWVNETFRVFYDRLINEDDRAWYKNLIIDLLGRNFKMSPEKDDLFDNLRFGDLLKLDSPVQYYEYIGDKPKLLKTLHGALDEYNMSNSSKMNLVLFDDALEHILRIARCLKQPRGHIMLIGVGGSGKQSLLKLCTYMRGMEYKSIEITKGFGSEAFREVMKGFMKEAGIGGTGISFVMTDTQIIDETFIENLNNLLNTGEIPNLMIAEDKDEITNGVRTICNERKIVDTIENINNLFIDRVREYLHICLCMSPVGSTLRVRCRQFPSLVNCCTLDWFSRWPEQALLFVSNEFLKELPDATDEVKSGLAEMCMRIHISVEEAADRFYESLRRRVYTTPKSYLDLISLYLKKLDEQRNEFHLNKNRLAIGLKKLNDTNSNIAELKIKIESMQPKLVAKNAELKVSLVQVNADKAIADEKEKVVSGEAEIVNKKAADAKEIADDANADLAAAKPELAAAQNAVKQLDKNSIVEIKAFTQPPDGVKFVMECVMVMLGEKTEWKIVKQVLGNPGEFMNRLLTYDVETVSEKIWKKARDGWISKPQFEPAEVKKISMAASALCTWAVACSRYQIVVKKVAPKKKKLAEVTTILAEATAELQIKLDMVQAVKDKVAQLEADCQKMQDEKEELEFTMEQSSGRMRRAEKLVVLLADEGVRWAETVELIQGQIERLVGDVFISCACISYFGAFTGAYREELVKVWSEGCMERNIPTTEECSVVKTMGDPVILRNWGIAGLPSDQVSSENGILTMSAERYALCIDPQQQANKWIKNMEKNNNLLVLKFGTTTFLRDITGAVRNGKPVLVEDVEENTDPAIDPILLKQQFKSDSGIMQIRLGDSNSDYDEGFKFFMTTKLPNPHYIPEICIKVTLINFTVTFDGLEQQMLGDVVIAEKPEIEAKRDQIVLTMAADAGTLKDLENTILKLLSEATLEMILDEDTLIDILENSKKTSTEINERMAQSKIVEVEINETRNLYTNVAIRGSILYFVIADLGGIDPMYQNSLAYVKSLFNKAIQSATKDADIDKRIVHIIKNITRIIYTNISRGLFEKDKLIYSFLINTSILRNAKKIDEAIWNIFLRGPTVFTSNEQAAMPGNPSTETITPISWDILYSADLRSSGQFEGIAQHVVDNWSKWEEWIGKTDPYEETMPGDYQENLSNFDKLILIKVFRNELVQQAMSTFIIREMEQFFVVPPSTAIDILYENIDEITPLIFVLTQGADPTSQLLKFATDMNFMDKLFPISLGQGQGPKAERLIAQAHEEGQWVMLQNCHLARSWMPKLEKIVLDFPEKRLAGKIHADFRLYLTSMPAPYFPVSVLQNSVKLTIEPPRGMKANLKRSWNNFNQDFIEQTSKPEIWRKLLFSFSFFHAVLQERRKFGPLGWNIKYEFNDSDLETTNTMLKLFMDSQDEVPFDALLFVTGHINYGGRVTDDNDRRCLMTILEKYCHTGALVDGYKFTSSDTYFCPPDGKVQVYRDYIESLPLNDNPQIFGLHDNANITFMAAESNRIVETILSIQPRVAAIGGGMTPDEIVIEKAKFFLENLPEILNPKEGLKELFITNAQGLIPSLSTVLLQEVEKFNRLLKKMNRSLIDIDLAIRGFIVMGDELDSMYLQIQNNRVPLNWSKVGYPCLKPLSSWFKDFLQRVEFMRFWLNNGNPSSYWLPGMFFPQGFMTGVLQTHARQYKIAIDRLSFSFEIQEAEGPEEIEQKPEDGVYVYGTFIDGARWDRDTQKIADQFPSKMTETMPVVWFQPKEDYKTDPEDYLAPLYKTSLRAGVLSTTGQSTNFVVHVSIPSNENPNIWITRAAAMLCMLND